ncbi:MAG: hypothetical protein R3D00_05390 [Bacteroidia bacterium]
MLSDKKGRKMGMLSVFTGSVYGLVCEEVRSETEKCYRQGNLLE